jgi:hypothetical protein
MDYKEMILVVLQKRPYLICRKDILFNEFNETADTDDFLITWLVKNQIRMKAESKQLIRLSRHRKKNTSKNPDFQD